MGQQIADPRSALALLIELTAGAEQLHAVGGVHEGETLALDVTLRDRLAVQLDELRLIIEQLQLRWPARHEEIDDVLSARCEQGLLWRQRILRGRSRAELVVGKQRRERNRPQPHAALAEEVAAGGRLKGRGHHYADSFYAEVDPVLRLVSLRLACSVFPVNLWI